MHSFRNILYASTGIGDDIEGLKQALSLARANQAALKCLLVFPDLPRSHEMYQEKYREFMLEQMDTAVRPARTSLHLRGSEPPVAIELDAGVCAATPASKSRPTPSRTPCRTPRAPIRWNSAG